MLRFLAEAGFEAQTAMTIAESREKLAARTFDAVLIDQKLPDGNGIDLIAELRSANPDIAIVVITGAGDVPLAVEAMRRGADNFLTKPLRFDELRVFLQKSLDVSSLRRIVKTRDILDKKVQINFGISKAMGRVIEMARLAAESDYPALITGETGVGKGVLARWIHENSARRAGAFVEVGCPSFRGELLNNELYGHARGAFTSAVQDHAGLLDASDRGTLFLDEIGEMDLAVQAQFLKVIEDKTYRRLGEVRVRRSDFRLICATNKDLQRESAAGGFRKDLLFRIQALPVAIPPLRERREDIPELAGHFLAACNYQYRTLAPAVTDYLCAYPWPGNIRELRYVVERAVLLSRGGELRLEHFSGIETGLHPGGKRADAAESENAYAIRDVLIRCGNDVNSAATMLGISRATLYRRIKKMNIQLD